MVLAVLVASELVAVEVATNEVIRLKVEDEVEVPFVPSLPEVPPGKVDEAVCPVLVAEVLEPVVFIDVPVFEVEEALVVVPDPSVVDGVDDPVGVVEPVEVALVDELVSSGGVVVAPVEDPVSGKVELAVFPPEASEEEALKFESFS